jgi:hypothetical protein
MVAALLISAALAAASSALLSGSAPTRVPAPSPVGEIQAVPPAAAVSFAILRRPPRPIDAFVVVRPGAGPLGANPALARTVREPAGGLSAGYVSVVPADGAVCLRVPVAARGAQWWCQTLALAREGRLIMALRPAGKLRTSEQLLIGLVPDGVRSVTVTADGVRRSVPVRSNVYDAQIYDPQQVSIELPGTGARRSYPAP